MADDLSQYGTVIPASEDLSQYGTVVPAQQSIGQRALKNLPASTLNFVKNLPSMMPGVPQGQPKDTFVKGEGGRYTFNPNAPGIGEQIAAPFQSLWQTITNPGESFAQDPVGTVALPLMLLSGGRNVLRAPAAAVKEAVKAGVKAGLPDVAVGSAVGAGAGLLSEGLPPELGWPIRIGAAYPAVHQVVRGIKKGVSAGMEAGGPAYQSTPSFHLLEPLPPPPGAPRITTPFKTPPPGMSLPDIEAAHQASVESIGKRFAEPSAAPPSAAASAVPSIPPPPPNVDPKAWAELPDTVRNAIQEGAAKRAAGVGYTPPPTDPITINPPGPALKPPPAAEPSAPTGETGLPPRKSYGDKSQYAGPGKYKGVETPEAYREGRAALNAEAFAKDLHARGITAKEANAWPDEKKIQEASKFWKQGKLSDESWRAMLVRKLHMEGQIWDVPGVPPPPQ